MLGTPQQNGIVGRWNHTLMKMDRSMINYTNIPLSLWMYALKSVSYMFNRVPSKTIPKTLYEL